MATFVKRLKSSSGVLFVTFLLLLSSGNESRVQAQTNGSCSATDLCSGGLCCSKYNYCGSTESYCGPGCLSQCTNSSAPPPAQSPPPPGPKQTGFIVTYWGQDGNEGSLSGACLTGNYKILILSFISSFGGGRAPQLNLAGHCSPYDNGCAGLSQDISTCQENGVKVFVALGGGTGGYGLTSPSDAENLAAYLWNNFLGGQDNSSSRPLGSAVLDGIDFDIESGGSQYYSNLAESLKAYYETSQNKRFYLSAAPQCPYPDAYDGPGVGTALGTGLFDYVWVQFYNNDGCEYHPEGRNTHDLLASWRTWTTALHHSKIFLGLPASPSASSGSYNLQNGFIPSEVAVSHVLPRVRKSKNYGGVMLWSYEYDQNPSYSSTIISAV